MVLCHFVFVSLCFIRKKIKPFEGLLNWVCVDTSFVDKQFPGFLPMKRVQLSIHNAYMDHTLFLYQSLYMHWIKMKNPLYELDKLIINNVLILKKKNDANCSIWINKVRYYTEIIPWLAWLLIKCWQLVPRSSS